MNILQKIFKGNPTFETAKTIIEAQRAALFTTYHVKDIDAATATDDELRDALFECGMYWSVAYPETDNERVETIEVACKAELAKREEKKLREFL